MNTKILGFIGICMSILAMGGGMFGGQAAVIATQLNAPGSALVILALPAVLFAWSFWTKHTPTRSSWIWIALYAAAAYLFTQHNVGVLTGTYSAHAVALVGYMATLMMEGVLEGEPVFRAAPSASRSAMPPDPASIRGGNPRRS